VWSQVSARDPVADKRQLDQAARLTTNTRKQPNALISPTIGVLRQDLGRAALDINDHHLDRGPNLPATSSVDQYITA
jgi:hypothetical protein